MGLTRWRNCKIGYTGSDTFRVCSRTGRNCYSTALLDSVEWMRLQPRDRIACAVLASSQNLLQTENPAVTSSNLYVETYSGATSGVGGRESVVMDRDRLPSMESRDLQDEPSPTARVNTLAAPIFSINPSKEPIKKI